MRTTRRTTGSVVVDAENLVEHQEGCKGHNIDKCHERVKKLELVPADVELENVINSKKRIDYAFQHGEPISVNTIRLYDIKTAQDQRKHSLHDIDTLQHLPSVQQNQQPLPRSDNQWSSLRAPDPPHAQDECSHQGIVHEDHANEDQQRSILHEPPVLTSQQHPCARGAPLRLPLPHSAGVPALGALSKLGHYLAGQGL